jgi:hypothetical protein
MNYAAGMSHVREWLDRKKLQSCDFKLIGGPGAGFEIGFARASDAAEFQGFSWPK